MNELHYIISTIRGDLVKVLDNAGIYYRIFSRQKSNTSIIKKLTKNSARYRKENKKLQDIIGIRIVFYFMDDVEIINKFLHDLPNYVDDSDSNKDIKKISEKLEVGQIDNLDDKIFMPTRLNLIFRMEEKLTEELQKELNSVNDFDPDLIDNTYEIQLRTVLSEGWHEVEHDLRYKTKDESWWQYCDVESRMLNGIYATLETSERAMNHVFSAIAYKNYRNKEWDAMLRNHLRLHTSDFHLSNNLIKLLTNDIELAKSVFRIDRNVVIETLLKFGNAYPLKMDNLIFLINRLLKEPSLSLISMENKVIKELLDKKISKQS